MRAVLVGRGDVVRDPDFADLFDARDLAQHGGERCEHLFVREAQPEPGLARTGPAHDQLVALDARIPATRVGEQVVIAAQPAACGLVGVTDVEGDAECAVAIEAGALADAYRQPGELRDLDRALPQLVEPFDR